MPVGTLRFIVPQADRVSERAVQQAYLAGFDGIPAYCRARTSPGELIIEREGVESAKLYLPWPIEGFGTPLVVTGTLQQRERPYLLPVELARGKLNQTRNQLADWQQLGLDTPADLMAALAESMSHFTAAACDRRDPAAASERAQQSLTASAKAAELLARAYTEQALAVRHQTVSKLPIAFGSSLGHRPPEAAAATAFASISNTAVIPLLWRHVVSIEDEYNWAPYIAQFDWCRAQNLNVTAGPLIRSDDRGMPPWLTLWQHDVAGIMSFTSEYVSKAVQKFRGKVSFWHAAAFTHRPDSLGLKDEEKLRVVVRAVETVRRYDAETPIIVSFDQPWGEFLRRTPVGYAPLHVADHLVRSGVPIAAIGLEIDVGYWPDGVAHRDPLEWSRMIDQWSLLGLPLYLFLAAPSGVDEAGGKQNVVLNDNVPGGWSPATQAAWIKQIVPMLLAKPAVQGIAWQQAYDGKLAALPGAGLFDASGKPKPALAELAALRTEHLV
jgi:hypothetical protein